MCFVLITCFGIFLTFFFDSGHTHLDLACHDLCPEIHVLQIGEQQIVQLHELDAQVLAGFHPSSEILNLKGKKKYFVENSITCKELALLQ